MWCETLVKDLIKIRKNNPNLIGNDLFEAYIEAIIEDRIGMYPVERNIVVRKIGHINFIVN